MMLMVGLKLQHAKHLHKQAQLQNAYPMCRIACIPYVQNCFKAVAVLDGTMEGLADLKRL